MFFKQNKHDLNYQIANKINVNVNVNRTYKAVWHAAQLYFLWTFLHYGSTHLYVHVCTPSSIWGFITSPLHVSTPHCQLLRWVIYEGGANLTIMTWTLLLYILKYIC